MMLPRFGPEMRERLLDRQQRGEDIGIKKVAVVLSGHRFDRLDPRPSTERLADGVVQSVNVVLAAVGCVVLGVLAGTHADDPRRLAAHGGIKQASPRGNCARRLPPWLISW